MYSHSFITCAGITFLALEVLSWHALLDAPDSDPVASTALGESNFLIYRKRLPWVEAQTVCESTVGRLAVLPTLEDAVSLVSDIQSISEPFSEKYEKAVHKYEFGMDRRYWIGLSDLAHKNDWVWARNGTKLDYEFWYPNQPDHGGSSNSEHCGVLWNPGYHYGDTHSFNDEDCLHKQYFICEKYSPADKSETDEPGANEIPNESPTPDEPQPDDESKPDDETTADEPSPDEPKPDEPNPDEPVADEPAADEPSPEESKPDEPTNDESNPDETTNEAAVPVAADEKLPTASAQQSPKGRSIKKHSRSHPVMSIGNRRTLKKLLALKKPSKNMKRRNVSIKPKQMRKIRLSNLV